MAHISPFTTDKRHIANVVNTVADATSRIHLVTKNDMMNLSTITAAPLRDQHFQQICASTAHQYTSTL